MTTLTDTGQAHETFAHLALFYGDHEEYVSGVRQFVQPGLDASDPVVVAVPAERLEVLRDGLNDAAASVEFVDMVQLGWNPGRIISAVQTMVDRHAGRRLHYVGEPIWAGRTEEEIREATRHEALINLAWSDAPIRVLCPYDTASLDGEVIADAGCTHPHVVDTAGSRPSPRYAGPVVPASCDAPLPEPPADATALRFGRDDLERVRTVVMACAERAELDAGRAADLLLAVNEAAANSVLHAGGGGVLRAWRTDGRLTCEVRDRGYIADPLAGRRLPDPAAPGGRGLWLMQQLCDLVETRTGHAGTAVRLHITVA